MQVYGKSFNGSLDVEVDGIPTSESKRTHKVVTPAGVRLQARTMKGYNRGDRVFFQLTEDDLFDMLVEVRQARKAMAAHKDNLQDGGPMHAAFLRGRS